MKYAITYHPNPKHEETNIIWRGISANAKNAKGLPSGKPFAFFIRDEEEEIKGGCSGYIFYGCLYIDLLWVDQSLRNKRYGTQLMGKAEQLALDSYCHFMTVNTMDFEALGFYKKLGFVIEFTRTGFEKNSAMHFLRKDIKLKQQMF